MLRISLTIGLVLASAAAVAVYLHSISVPQYQARVLLWIDAEQLYLVYPDVKKDPDFVRDQINIIRSSLVLAPVLAEPDIATLPAVVAARASIGEEQDSCLCLRNLIDVSSAWGTEYYYISCLTSDPESSAAIANAVANSYLRFAGPYAQGRVDRLLRLLDVECEATKREVKRLRENVCQMAMDQHRIQPFASRTRRDGEKSACPGDQIAGRLGDVLIEKTLLQARIDAFEKEDVEKTSDALDATVEEAITRDSFAERLRSAIAERRFGIVELELAKETRGENVETEALRLKEGIQLLEANLSRRREELRVSISDHLKGQTVDRRNAQLAALKTAWEEFTVEERVLASVYEEERKQALPSSGATLELEFKQAELKRAEQVLDSISERAFVMRTEQRAPTRVELVEQAAVPELPVSRVPVRMMILAALSGFLAPLIVCVPVAAVRTCRRSAGEPRIRPEPEAVRR